ncbi:MAG TPA: hypothetical protein PKZ27_13685 [Rhodocyclaceae bacterium]|jgi:hypothetical protein|nr:hypothetical protein [Rhodocyclaceae bacterium]
MNAKVEEHEVGRRYVGCFMVLLGAVVAAFGARDFIGFEPLPAVVSPETILLFLDFRRYFGVWPGLLGILAGVGFLVIGLLVLMGYGAGPLSMNARPERPTQTD